MSQTARWAYKHHLSLLTVIGPSAVFALPMFCQDMFWQRLGLGINTEGQEGHFAEFFQDQRVISGLGWTGSPGKGTMTADQNHRHSLVVKSGKTLENLLSGCRFVIAGHF